MNPAPWLQPRHGRVEAARFFERLGAFQFPKFSPKAFLEGEGLVVALVDVEATVRQTRKPIVEQGEAHIWHFDASRRVVRLRRHVDTYQYMSTHQG